MDTLLQSIPLRFSEAPTQKFALRMKTWERSLPRILLDVYSYFPAFTPCNILYIVEIQDFLILTIKDLNVQIKSEQQGKELISSFERQVGIFKKLFQILGLNMDYIFIIYFYFFRSRFIIYFSKSRFRKFILYKQKENYITKFHRTWILQDLNLQDIGRPPLFHQILPKCPPNLNFFSSKNAYFEGQGVVNFFLLQIFSPFNGLSKKKSPLPPKKRLFQTP